MSSRRPPSRQGQYEGQSGKALKSCLKTKQPLPVVDVDNEASRPSPSEHATWNPDFAAGYGAGQGNSLLTALATALADGTWSQEKQPNQTEQVRHPQRLSPVSGGRRIPSSPIQELPGARSSTRARSPRLQRTFPEQMKWPTTTARQPSWPRSAPPNSARERCTPKRPSSRSEAPSRPSSRMSARAVPSSTSEEVAQSQAKLRPQEGLRLISPGLACRHCAQAPDLLSDDSSSLAANTAGRPPPCALAMSTRSKPQAKALEDRQDTGQLAKKRLSFAVLMEGLVDDGGTALDDLNPAKRLLLKMQSSELSSLDEERCVSASTSNSQLHSPSASTYDADAEEDDSRDGGRKLGLATAARLLQMSAHVKEKAINVGDAMVLSKRYRIDYKEVKAVMQAVKVTLQDGKIPLDASVFEVFLLNALDVTYIDNHLVESAYTSSGAKFGKFDIDRFFAWYQVNMFAIAKVTASFESQDSDVMVQAVANKHNLNPQELADIKARFDRYDTDKSGEIEEPEFGTMMCEILGIPEGAAVLPKDRLQRFWKELDMNDSGSVDFIEFSEWYIKYFSSDYATDPLSAFYDSYMPQKQRHKMTFDARLRRTETNVSPPSSPDKGPPPEDVDGTAARRRQGLLSFKNMPPVLMESVPE